MTCSDLRRPRRSWRVFAVSAMLATGLGTMGLIDSAYAGSGDGAPHASAAIDLGAGGWIWPSASFRLERPYEAPAHRYASGHRGVDLRLLDAPAVRAPADGGVAFVGSVAGRGVLTIDHGDGLVTTLEPVDSALAVGDVVRRGDAVGALALGGHSAPGTLHFGVRLDGEYINPLLLLGGVPRAVLLPCC
jgi:murein DD-endopeptidase MepM/ murein hydrolase activator NlpD